MDFLLLLVGFVLLIKGADYFVEGSSSLAKIMKIPAVIIGLTIVAMGTSAPEASVSINAALAGNNDIAISNVIGSNIFNGMVVVGVCAIMQKFAVNLEIAKRDLPINILISILLCFMIADGNLSRLEGIILLIGMVAFIGMMVHAALKNREEGEEIVDPETYNFECFDAVLLPAVKQARLNYMHESVDTKALKLRKALTEQLEKATEDDKEIMKETLKNLNIELEEEEVADWVDPEDQAVENESEKRLVEEDEELLDSEEDVEEIDESDVDESDDETEVEESEDSEEESKEEGFFVKDIIAELSQYEEELPIEIKPIEIDGITYDVNFLSS